MARRLAKSRDKKLFGVAGGVAEYFDVDPTIVRLGMVVLCFLAAPVVFIAYGALAFLMPTAEETPPDQVDAPPTTTHRLNLFAWALIGFGVLIVLSRLGLPHPGSGWLLPVVLVGVGVVLLTSRSRLN